MTAPAQAVSNKPNLPTLDSLLTVAKELGEQAGKGKDTQIKFLLKTCEAAFLGVLDNDANKHGDKVDDATKLTEAYVKAQTGATIFDSKAPNQRKTISCTRTSIKLGMWPKGGVGEPLTTVNDFITERTKLRKDPATAKKLDDAANAFLRFARAQIKMDRIMTVDEYRSFLFKTEPEAQTVEDFWIALRKRMQNLKAGKGANALQDTATQVDAVISAANVRLTAIANARKGSQGPQQ